MICMPANSNPWFIAVNGGSDLFAYINDTKRGQIMQVHFLVLTRRNFKSNQAECSDNNLTRKDRFMH